MSPKITKKLSHELGDGLLEIRREVNNRLFWNLARMYGSYEQLMKIF